MYMCVVKMEQRNVKSHCELWPKNTRKLCGMLNEQIPFKQPALPLSLPCGAKDMEGMRLWKTNMEQWVK